MDAATRHTDCGLPDGDGEAFRDRAASALTHPLTVAALGVLLLNDLLLKSLWPGAWVSGKLSDLAWLIFAVPLLAFLLSLVARQHHRAQRLSFAAAFVGLPLLYAAFNALDPLHDAIMRGIGALAGGVGSSPRDATDSLVIPLAWSIALWVWRRGPVGRSALRLRWALLLAGVASLASVATSAPSPDHGIRSVGAAEDTGVYALRYQGHHPEAISGLRPTYHSADGGLTWRGVPEGVDRVPWGASSVETPRGRYALDGPRLVRIAGGQRQVVYSADYLGKAGNVWVQKHATSHLNERELTSEPQALAYDPRSGNVIVALGLLGVLLETADGELTHVAAGRYAPVDFSLVGKTRLLVSHAPFWAAALAVALSWTSMGLVIAQRRKGDLVARLPIAIAAVVAPALLGIPLLFLIFYLIEVTDSSAPLALLGLLCASIGAAIFFGLRPRHYRSAVIASLALALVPVLASSALPFMFGASNDEAFSLEGFYFGAVAAGAWVFGLAALAVSLRLLRYWRAAAASLAGMALIVVLAFMLWLHAGVPQVLVAASSIALCALAALRLAGYINARTPPAQRD